MLGELEALVRSDGDRGAGGGRRGAQAVPDGARDRLRGPGLGPLGVDLQRQAVHHRGVVVGFVGDQISEQVSAAPITHPNLPARAPSR